MVRAVWDTSVTRKLQSSRNFEASFQVARKRNAMLTSDQTEGQKCIEKCAKQSKQSCTLCKTSTKMIMISLALAND